MSSSPLLTIRAAITILFGLVIGCGAGVLAYLDNGSAPGAVLVGMGAWGGALALLDKILADPGGNDGQDHERGPC